MKENNMIGNKIEYTLGGDSILTGTIIDKVRIKTTTYAQYPNEDTYLVEKEDGYITTVHPTNIKRIIRNKETN